MNKEVTKLLDDLNHPFRKEIETLRGLILSSRPGVEEIIKWNGPTYKVGTEDRVSIKVYPTNAFHIILHIGAKVKEQPKERLLSQDYGLLTWKTNDRAIATFKDATHFEAHKPHIVEIVKNWFEATL